LPFLYIRESARVSFTNYSELCSRYKNSCAILANKTRLRGVKLILPKDVIVGDEQVLESSLNFFYSRFDPESRDEGLDYEGATKVLNLHLDEAAEVGGFVYDIGPASAQEAVQEIECHQFLLVWGTAGLCEVGPFQEGTKKIFNVSAKRPWAVDPKAMGTDSESSSRQVIVIGESASEWFLRFIDPDGSETKGDLVGAGVVACACRDSVFFTGIMGSYKCSSLSRMVRRNAVTEEEWIYNKQTINVDQEELEDEEDDDDDE